MSRKLDEDIAEFDKGQEPMICLNCATVFPKDVLRMKLDEEENIRTNCYICNEYDQVLGVQKLLDMSDELENHIIENMSLDIQD